MYDCNVINKQEISYAKGYKTSAKRIALPKPIGRRDGPQVMKPKAPDPRPITRADGAFTAAGMSAMIPTPFLRSCGLAWRRLLVFRRHGVEVTDNELVLHCGEESLAGFSLAPGFTLNVLAGAADFTREPCYAVLFDFRPQFFDCDDS